MARCKNGFKKSRRKLDKGNCISKNTVKRKRCPNGSRKVGTGCQPNASYKKRNIKPKSPSHKEKKQAEEEVVKAESFYYSDNDDLSPAELAARRRKQSPTAVEEPTPPTLVETKKTPIAKKKKGHNKSKQNKTKKVVTKDGRIYKRGRRVKSKEKLWQPT